MKKSTYIDLIERVFNAYSHKDIIDYIEDVEKNGLSEHGYPRLTVNLGVLIAHGRKSEYKELFIKMMNLCCDEIPVAHARNGYRAGNAFSVKEVVFCILELEKSGVFEKKHTDLWREKLAGIDPYETYSCMAGPPPERAHNWAAFNATSEQLRKYAGIGDESEFIDKHIYSQILSFDENGMYRDPNEPMVYDLVTRLQLALALKFGYNGKHKDELYENIMKAGDITLSLQSVSGELPFGGRSSQFLHNEATFAALLEYYASEYKARGEIEKAGKFKRAVRRAVEAILPWLDVYPMRHIKNYYPTDSNYGCEGYGYYAKYMISCASMLYSAYLLADDDIEETTEDKNFITNTSVYFHKQFVKFNDYYVELEEAGDVHYDTSGIGRIHKRGVPSALCLSVPFTDTPEITLDIKNPTPLSICCGLNGEFAYDAKYNLLESKLSDSSAHSEYECILKSGARVLMSYTVSDSGVEIKAEGNGEAEISFALFEFDGEEHTSISLGKKMAKVKYNGFECVYSTDGEICGTDTVYANRNGHYKAAYAYGENSVSLKIELQ